jgi:hypothetical protein
LFLLERSLTFILLDRYVPGLESEISGVMQTEAPVSTINGISQEWQKVTPFKVLVITRGGVEIDGRSGLHPSHRGSNEWKIGICSWSPTFARAVQIQDWQFIYEIWKRPLSSSSFYFIAFTTSQPQQTFINRIHLSCSGAKIVLLIFYLLHSIALISSNYKKSKITKLLNWNDRWNYRSIQCITQQPT